MRLITLLLLCTLVVYPAFAEDAPGFYVGVSVGQASLDGTVTGNVLLVPSSVDDEDTLWGLTIGYDSGQWFALELSYVDLGKSSSTIDFIGPSFTAFDASKRTTSVSGLTLSGLARYEFAPRFSAYGRAGLSAMRLKLEDLMLRDGCVTASGAVRFEPTCTVFRVPIDLPAGTAVSDTNTEYRFMFGLGLSADITDHFIGRLDFIEYDIDSLDAFALSLSLLYKF